MARQFSSFDNSKRQLMLSSNMCRTPPGCCRDPSRMLSLTLPNVVVTPPGCCRQPSRMLSRRPIVSVSGVEGSEATRDTRHPTLKIDTAAAPEGAVPPPANAGHSVGPRSVKNYIPISCQSYSLPKRRLRLMARERGVLPSRGCTRTELAGSGAWEKGGGMDPKYETAEHGSWGAQRRCATRWGPFRGFRETPIAKSPKATSGPKKLGCAENS